MCVCVDRLALSHTLLSPFHLLYSYVFIFPTPNAAPHFYADVRMGVVHIPLFFCPGNRVYVSW